MGKNLIQQARGKGSPTYKAPSFRYKGEAKVPNKIAVGEIKNIFRCPGHSAPLVTIQAEDKFHLMIAPEGVKIGDSISIGQGDVTSGNILSLKNVPVGTLVFNIENTPGDGGRFCRASGTFARVFAHHDGKVVLILPSKKKKTINGGCRATIGVVAGGGRKDKPMLKAGKKYHAMRAKNKLYPRVSATSMNAVDHPFGNSRSSRKSKARPTPRNAPPGRKVGMVGAKRTGRKKR